MSKLSLPHPQDKPCVMLGPRVHVQQNLLEKHLREIPAKCALCESNSQLAVSSLKLCFLFLWFKDAAKTFQAVRFHCNYGLQE